MRPENPHLLIDADILLYTCGFAAEKTYYLVERAGWYGIYNSYKEAKIVASDGDGYTIWSRKEVQPVQNALQNVKTTLKAIKEYWGEPRAVSLFLTGKGNFREMVAITKTYKDNRDPAHRPKHYRAVKDYLINTYGAQVVNGMEADDAIGIKAMELMRNYEPYVIVSNDKDLDQIQGWHYDWTKNAEWFIDSLSAKRVLYTQILCGDSTDNIPGIMSERKAFEAISKCSSINEMQDTVVQAYQKQYGESWKERLKEISSLVLIRTEPLKEAP